MDSEIEEDDVISSTARSSSPIQPPPYLALRSSSAAPQPQRHVTPAVLEAYETRSQSSEQNIPSSPPIISAKTWKGLSPSPPLSETSQRYANILEMIEKDRQALRKPPKKTETRRVSENLRQNKLNFDRGDHPKQERMRHVFTKELRSIALARELMNIVEENVQAGFESKVYDHIRAGAGNPERIANLINCVPHEMILALIDGNVAWRSENDPTFQDTLKLNSELEKFPGQYVLQFARVPKQRITDAETQRSQTGRIKPAPFAGAWLTPREVLKFVNGAKAYLEGDADFARQVDNAFGDERIVHDLQDYKNDWKGIAPGAPKGSPPGLQKPYRRFYNLTDRNATTRDQSKDRAQEWVTIMEELYVNRINDMIAANPQDPQLDVPIKWGPLEIGYGSDVASRAGQHYDFHKSNRLFVFQNCLITALFDPNRIHFKLYKFMVNRLPRPGKEAVQDANTSDVAITLIAKSYWFDGGANPDYAAGGGVNKERLASKDDLLRASRDLIYASASFYRGNLKKDLDAVSILEENLKGQKTVEADRKRIAEAWPAKLEELDQLERRVKDLQMAREVSAGKERIKAIEKLGVSSENGSDAGQVSDLELTLGPRSEAIHSEQHTSDD